MSKQMTLPEAKTAYAQAILNKNAGSANTVVVLPEFMQEGDTWVPTDSAVIASENSTKGFGYVCLVQSATVHLKGVEFENTLWTIQRGRVAAMESKYTPGTLLPGRIVTQDTLTPPNVADPTQNLKYISAAAREAKIACTLDDQPIYQERYWDPTNTQVDITLPHNNDVVALVAAKAVKANSAGIKNAAPVQAK